MPEKHDGDRMFAISEAALDQLHARIIAAEIVAVRLWGFLAMMQRDQKAYLDRQMAQCLQSVDARQIDSGHPDRIKMMAKDAIVGMFRGLVLGPPPGSLRQ